MQDSYSYKCIVYGKIENEVIFLMEIIAEIVTIPDIGGRNCCIRIKTKPDTINCCRYAIKTTQYGDDYSRRFVEGLASVLEMVNSNSVETHRLWDKYEAETYIFSEILPKLRHALYSWSDNCFLFINE